MFTLIKSKAYEKAESTYRSVIGEKRFEKMEKQLQENPKNCPKHIVKLEGADDLYRYRMGDYRVIYQVFDDEVEVLMMTIKPRGQAYK